MLPHGRFAIATIRQVHAPLDLADRVEIVADDHAVLDAQARLQAGGLFLDAVEDAAGLGSQRGVGTVIGHRANAH